MKRKAPKRQYKILIERDEDGYFTASAPALPGCYTQAKTLSELMARVRDAIVLCLDEMKVNPAYRNRAKRFAYEPTFVGMDVVTL